jgi:hypothetical protein
VCVGKNYESHCLPDARFMQAKHRMKAELFPLAQYPKRKINHQL